MSGGECVILVLQCGLVVTNRLLLISILIRNLSEEQQLDPRELQCVPEEFWNCAEISISPSGPSTPTASGSSAPITPSPPPPINNAQNMQPSIQAPMDLVLERYCGSSWFDAAKCGTPCPDGNSTACPESDGCYADVTCSPTQDPGTCRGGNVGNGICPDPSLCCSKWGHCGTSSAYCDRRQLRSMNTTENEEIIAF